MTKASLKIVKKMPKSLFFHKSKYTFSVKGQSLNLKLGSVHELYKKVGGKGTSQIFPKTFRMNKIFMTQ